MNLVSEYLRSFAPKLAYSDVNRSLPAPVYAVFTLRRASSGSSG